MTVTHMSEFQPLLCKAIKIVLCGSFMWDETIIIQTLPGREDVFTMLTFKL